MTQSEPLLGAHMSIAGGLDKAIERGESVGSTALQIFTKSANQWRAKPLQDEDIARFKARLAASAIGPDAVVVHDSYLINLGTPDDAKWEQSIAAFTEELRRCDLLAIPYLVTHPGAHTGSGEEAGLQRVAAGMVRALDATERAMVLLETTAGQGTYLGGRFEHLAQILELTPARYRNRVGICLDTCHVFAAGYDISTPEGYATTFAEFDRLIGRENLKVLHLNDSKKPLGSHADRHEHIGQGCIGETGFRLLMNDPLLQGLPHLLETPKGDDLAEDRENIAFLRSLVGKTA